MKKWKDFSLEQIHDMSKNIVTLLKLPLLDNILRQKRRNLKLKSNRNNVLAMIKPKEKDMVLGFLTKNPGLLTRQYANFVTTSEI